MSVYRRRDQSFNERLSVRSEELKTVVTQDEQGRVILSALPYLKFPSQDCAEQFLRRVVFNSNKPRRIQK